MMALLTESNQSETKLALKGIKTARCKCQPDTRSGTGGVNQKESHLHGVLPYDTHTHTPIDFRPNSAISAAKAQ